MKFSGKRDGGGHRPLVMSAVARGWLRPCCCPDCLLVVCSAVVLAKSDAESAESVSIETGNSRARATHGFNARSSANKNSNVYTVSTGSQGLAKFSDLFGATQMGLSKQPG